MSFCTLLSFLSEGYLGIVYFYMSNGFTIRWRMGTDTSALYPYTISCKLSYGFALHSAQREECEWTREEQLIQESQLSHA